MKNRIVTIVRVTNSGIGSLTFVYTGNMDADDAAVRGIQDAMKHPKYSHKGRTDTLTTFGRFVPCAKLND